MAVAPANPTQITPPRVAFIDERSGAISREWYRFFLSLRNAVELNQQETALSVDANSLIASYDAMLADLAQEVNSAPDSSVLLSSYQALLADLAQVVASAPDSNVFTASLESQFYTFQNDILVAPPSQFGTVTSVAASGGTTGLTFTGSPITTSGTLTLGGTLGTANGGTNSTATPIAGGVAYGTGTAILVNAAGPAGYVLTSGGAAPPIWTPVASLATSTQAYWGSFWDTTTQTAAAVNTAYTITLNSSDPTNNGVSIVSGSRMTFAHAGVYSLTFSIQFVNTDNATAAHETRVWLRKNNSGSTGDVPDTGSKFTIPPKHAGLSGSLIGTVNFVDTFVAGDFVELLWTTDDVAVAITSLPAGTTPVSPTVPGVIFTAVAAAPVGLGYAGVVSVTSLTISTGSKVLTVNTNATDTAFIVGNRVRLVNSAVNYMDGVITAYSGTTLTVLVDGIAGSGTYTSWAVSLTGSVGGVTSFAGNSTGLTPTAATTGAITLAGTLVAANGGTGQSVYAIGDLLYASTTTALSKLADVATGNALISGGVGVAPLYGKIGLTTHVSGTLPVANGGTGVAVSTGTVAVVLSTSPTLITPILGVASATSIATGLGAVGTPAHTFTGDTSTGIWSPATGNIAVSNGGVETMRIGSSGNVGVGTSSPGSYGRLAAVLNATGVTTIAVSNSNTTANDGAKFASFYGTTEMSSIGHYWDGGSFIGKVFSYGDLTFLLGSGTPVERMRISNVGAVGIGTTANASALLDVQSTTKGVRMPNMTTTQKVAITSPAAGLMVFDTTLAKLCVYSGAAWQTVTSV